MKMLIKKYGNLAILGVAIALVGCATDPTTLGKAKTSKPGAANQDPYTADQQGDAVGGVDTTFDHNQTLGDNEAGPDPFAIAQQRAEEGPPEIRTRMHSCQKLQVSTIGNILTSLGVDLTTKSTNGAPPTAGELLSGGGTALGAANYTARVGESLVWTAAGAAKQFDIFVQAAPQIIANIQNAPACQVNGSGPVMFNPDNTCNRDAVSCLMGKPASDDHVAICNNLVTSGSSLDKGKALAVATILAAAHSCE